VPYNICGKVIVATSERELPQLDELYRRGNKNGLNGVADADRQRDSCNLNPMPLAFAAYVYRALA